MWHLLNFPARTAHALMLISKGMVVITVQKSFGSLQPIMDIKARRAQVKNPSGIDGFRMFKGP